MRKLKPIIPKTHMDSSYMQELTKLSDELDAQYDQLEELQTAKHPFEQEAKEVLDLETSWNNLVKMAVMDRAERKRCLIG